MRVTLAGATGMVGGLLLQALRDDPLVKEIHLVGRRAPDGAGKDARVRFHQADFAHLPTDAPWARVEHGYCCLGTTIRAAGSKEAFRAVDHDAVLAFASALRRAGTLDFRSVSSVGADPNARSFYLRVKGETERELTAMNFPHLTLFRPGLLRGPRAEFRLGERVALATSPLWQLFLPGKARRYRPTRAAGLAAAMHTLPPADGVRIWHDHLST
ncbi:MAG: hypothetical protein O3A20_01040 [Planctomycetota bacterium]|nr:hypothetical protein [Planctomycetota bacterium]